jgi:hypothetical protein
MQETKLKVVTRWIALVGITIITLSATAVAFIESYAGLETWAADHGLYGTWAWIWPVQIDAFILIGELALYVAVLERWSPWRQSVGWAVTLLGGAVSVMGNIGHVGGGHSGQVYGTAAVPPLAATAGLAVGLQMLKWCLHLTRDKVRPVPLTVTLSPAGSAFRLAPLHWSMRTLAAPAPLTQSEALSAPWSLPAPRVAALPAPVTERPVRATVRTGGDLSKHPLWDQGLQAYARSADDGSPLSTRGLAMELGMKNRVLATAIIKAYKEGTQP